MYYPTPVHWLATFEADKNLPVTTQLAGKVVSRPVHPRTTDSDRERTVVAVNTMAEAGA